MYITGCSDVAKVSCILRHRGIQLMLAYSWARPAIIVAGKGRGGMFLLRPQLRRSWRGILLLGRLCVRPSSIRAPARPLRFLMHSITAETVHARVSKFHIRIPHEKIADMYFFPSGLCPFPKLWPFEKI